MADVAEFQSVSSDPPACASAASAWGNQQVISIALCIRHAILTSLGYRDCGWPEDYDLLLPLRGLPSVRETTLSARSISLILCEGDHREPTSYLQRSVDSLPQAPTN